MLAIGFMAGGLGVALIVVTVYLFRVIEERDRLRDLVAMYEKGVDSNG